MYENVLEDLRYGFRMLLKSPGFTAVAALSLALGIGANTAIFTLIDAVLLKMLPVREPEQLVLFNWAAKDWPSVVRSLNGSSRREGGRSTSTSFSYPSFEQMRTRNTVLSDVFAFAGVGQRMTIGASGETAHATGQMVSANYFSGLGIRPVLGRTLTEADDQPGAAPVAVISHGYWQRRFGGDPDAAGKPITVNGVSFTIAGVTPPDFSGLNPGTAIEVSVPLAMQPQVAPRFMGGDTGLFTAPERWWVLIMGRLKPGVTRQQAQAALDVIFRQASTEGVTLPTDRPAILPWLELQPGSQGLDSLRRQYSTPLFILMSVVGVVLLIACANVANLLLARAAARQREIAVRLSLGTTRGRLVRQLLTESILLALLGTALGMAFAWWGTQVLIGLLTRGGTRLTLDLAPDLKVMGFTVAVTSLTALLFGLAPALRATRVDVMSVLRESASTQGARLRLGLAKALVVSQVALSLVLLCGAGLFVRTLVNLKSQETGFARDNLLLFGIDPTQAGYRGARLADFYAQARERILAIPGVTGATMSLVPLLSGGGRVNGIRPEWQAQRGRQQPQQPSASARIMMVGPAFLETMGIPLLFGRDLGPRDDETAPKVALVNKTLALRLYGSANAVGKRFGWGRAESAAEFEIVGVVKDARYESLRREIEPTVYLPIRQDLTGLGPLSFAVRSTVDPRPLVPAVRSTLETLDRSLPLYGIKTQEEQIDELLLQERLFAKLTSFFGVLALGLACVGLYGIFSYTVAKRTGEIGIRVALGAQRSDITGMVLRETLVLIGFGAVIGMPAAWAAARSAQGVISGLLFGLDGTDAVTIVAATLLMALAASAAGFLPARRASGVDPMVALRHE
jgi:predicted permease